MKVYALVDDYGDGTAGVKIYDGRGFSDGDIEELIENSPDYLWANSDGYTTWTLPDDFDFAAAGMKLITRGP